MQREYDFLIKSLRKRHLSTSVAQKEFNKDYDSESNDSTPQGEICFCCMGEGVRVSPNPNMDGEYEECGYCKGKGKLSHNQY